MVFRANKRQEIGVLALAASIGVVAYVISAYFLHDIGFPLDDSWIHQTYARNLTEHGEWAFVPGAASAASTSPLYTVVLALGYLLRLPFFAWTYSLGAVALFAGAWQASRLAQIMFPELGGAGIWTGLATVLSWHLVWAAASGMETMLFAAFSLWVIGLAWWEISLHETRTSKSEMQRGFGFGMVGGLLTLTRPEGIGLVALCGVFVLIAWPNEMLSGWRKYMWWAAGVGLGWLLVTGPYLAINFTISGGLLPDTSSAKQAENAPALDLPLFERYWRMLLPLAAGVQVMLIPGIIAPLIHIGLRVRAKRQSIMLFLPLGWASMLVTAYAWRLPAPYQHGRYVIPIVPILIVYGVGGTLLLVKMGTRRLALRVITRSLALSAALLTLVFWWIGARTYARDVRIINTEMVDTAHWVKVHLSTDELLAVHDIGALGYYAPRPILDLAGLVTPEIVPYLGDPDAVMRFMCEHDVVYLMVLPDQLPAVEGDVRLGGFPVFSTHSPYSLAAGGGNMSIYRMNWPDQCGP